MKQLLHVHGGDALKNGQDFYEYWDSDPLVTNMADPFVKGESKKKWKDDLAQQLGEEWACVFPRFPNEMDAHYPEWKWWFEKYVPFMKDGIVLTGHSLGGNFLAKYLSENRLPVAPKQLHLIAPAPTEGDFVLPDSMTLVSEQVPSISLYFSKDDPLVPFSVADVYHAALPDAAMVVFDDRGHFFAQESFPELVARIQTA